MKRRDWAAATLLLVWLWALLAYREAYVEPRSWGAACVAAAAPLACLPRAGLLWMQQYAVWGGAALAFGLAAFLAGPRWDWGLALAALMFGIAGVVNYNATFGLLGGAIGFWAWLSPGSPRRGAA
jgi:hypothetical protein